MQSLCLVVGPTGVGKSEYATALAERFSGEIINADSVQIRRGFDIGAAKPSPALRQRVPHHLYDMVEPDAEYSAADYAKAAAQTIERVVARRRLPILVGGSGFYLRALIEGLSEVEGAARQSDPAWELTRQRLSALQPSVAFDTLREKDPQMAARLHPNDRQRVIRALTVFELSGRPLSKQARPVSALQQDYNLVWLGLSMDRTQLYDRLNRRVEEMYECGLLQETTKPAKQLKRAIGYAEGEALRSGKLDREAAINLTAKRTRNYAKRQWTWFRHQPDITWFDALQSGTLDQMSQWLIEKSRYQLC